MTTPDLNIPIVAYPLGSAAPTPGNPYGFGFGVGRKGGWASFYADRLLPMIDAGYTEFLLHRPFGEVHDPADATMQIDARQTVVQDPDWQHAVWEAEQTLAMLSDRHPEVRLICYYGSIEQDMRERRQAFEHRQLIKRWVDALGEPLNLPNCDLCFDAASGWRYEDRLYQLLALLAHECKADQGRTAMIETMPLDQHWSDEASMPWLARYRFWAGMRNRQRRTGYVWVGGHEKHLIAQRGWSNIAAQIAGNGNRLIADYNLADDAREAMNEQGSTTT